MHRLGFPPGEAESAHRRLLALGNIDPDITLMTHFAASDEFENPLTEQQRAAFEDAVANISGSRALANSAGLLGWQNTRADWIRTGGLLYGLSVVEGKSGLDIGFEPAMTLTTKLIAINRASKGERIGYGATYECPEDMPIGVAAIGYGDGYPRSASAGTPVLIKGMRASIAGRISMDLITLDLRQTPGAMVGDRVTLWGRDLPVEEIALHAGTISYDLTCGMTKRVMFVEDDT